MKGGPPSAEWPPAVNLQEVIAQFDAGALREYAGAPDGNASAIVAALARKIADAKAMQRRARSLRVFRRDRSRTAKS